MNSIPVVLSTNGAEYATDDGRTLWIRSSVIVNFDFEIAYQPDLQDPDLPSMDTVIRNKCTIADADGQLWELTSHWSSALLVRAMTDTYLPWGTRRWSQRDDTFRNSFQQHLLLEDVSYGNDSRQGCQIVTGDEVAEVVFHYTSVSFDLSCEPDTDETYPTPELMARTTGRSTLFYHGTSDPLPELVFPVRWSSLLANAFAQNEETGNWNESDFPLPLAAAGTVRTGTPQSSVLVR